VRARVAAARAAMAAASATRNLADAKEAVRAEAEAEADDFTVEDVTAEEEDAEEAEEAEVAEAEEAEVAEAEAAIEKLQKDTVDAVVDTFLEQETILFKEAVEHAASEYYLGNVKIYKENIQKMIDKSDFGGETFKLQKQDALDKAYFHKLMLRMTEIKSKDTSHGSPPAGQQNVKSNPSTQEQSALPSGTPITPKTPLNSGSELGWFGIAIGTIALAAVGGTLLYKKNGKKTSENEQASKLSSIADSTQEETTHKKKKATEEVEAAAAEADKAAKKAGKAAKKAAAEKAAAEKAAAE